MVRSYIPQQMSNSIVANTIFIPQRMGTRGGPSVPTLLEVLFPPIADATFDHYKFYQIKKGQVPSTQTNMPLVIIDSLPVSTFAETTGFDIRVFDSAGVALDYDTEVADIMGTGSGDIVIWVDVATVADNEFIQIVFGKAGATDGSNPNAVYDSNYKSVWHLNGDGTDSTSNAQDIPITGTITEVAGKVGTAMSFPGTVNDFMDLSGYTGFPPTAFTISFWIKTTASDDGIINYRAPDDPNEFLAFDQGDLQIRINDLTRVSGNTFTDGVFHLLTVTWRSSTGQLIIYQDGVNVFSSTLAVGAVLDDPGSLVLGQNAINQGSNFNAGQSLIGVLDNVTIEDVERDQDFVTVTFNNQNDNDAFWFKTPLLANGIPALLVDDQGEPIKVDEQP